MSSYLSDEEYTEWKKFFFATPKQMEAYAEYLSGDPDKWEHEILTYHWASPVGSWIGFC